MTLVPAAVLLLVSIALAGGPGDLLDVLRIEIGGAVGAVIGWFGSWL